MGQKIPDLVVLLPGITGSELISTSRNRVIWGWSGGVLVRNLLQLGPSISEELLVKDDSPTAATLEDGVHPTRLMPDLHLLPGLWKVDGYGALQKYLESKFDLQLGRNFFPFPYDWRRDNRATALRLAKEAPVWLHEWRKRSGNPDAKLLIIAHSMGGLIARYFLEVFRGWRDTTALITFGTPFAGSINAVDSLVNGVERCGIELTNALRSMHSLHQLLPTHKCCDTGDGELRHLSDVPLARLDAARLHSGLKFHAEIAEACRDNEREAAYRDSGFRIFTIVGRNQPTRQSVRVTAQGLTALNTIGTADPGGDGTVPLQSAVPKPRDLPSATFISTRHAALHNDPAALSHLHGVVTALYLQPFRGGSETHQPLVEVSLDVDDMYWSGEPVEIRARADDPRVTLRATLYDKTSTRAVDAVDLVEGQDSWHCAQFHPDHAGTYQVVIAGDAGKVQQAHDVFEVVAAPPSASQL